MILTNRVPAQLQDMRAESAATESKSKRMLAELHERNAKTETLNQRVEQLEMALALKNRQASEEKILYEQTLGRARGEMVVMECETEGLKTRISTMEDEARAMVDKTREKQESETINRTKLELEMRVLTVKFEGLQEVLALREDEKRRMESTVVGLQRELEDRNVTLDFRQRIRKERDERSGFEMKVSRQRVESIEESLRLMEQDYEENTKVCMELRTSLEQALEDLRERDEREKVVEFQHQLEVRVLTTRIEALQEDLKSVETDLKSVKHPCTNTSEKGSCDACGVWAGASSLSTFGSSIRLSLGKEIGRETPSPWHLITHDPLGAHARAREHGDMLDEVGGGQGCGGQVIISADLCFTGPEAVAFSDSSSDHARWDVERDGELTMLGAGPEKGRCSPDLSRHESAFLLPHLALQTSRNPRNDGLNAKVVKMLSRRLASCSLLRCFYHWCRMRAGAAIQSAEKFTGIQGYEQDVTNLREMQETLVQDRRKLQMLLAKPPQIADHDFWRTSSSSQGAHEMRQAQGTQGDSNSSITPSLLTQATAGSSLSKGMAPQPGQTADMFQAATQPALSAQNETVKSALRREAVTSLSMPDVTKWTCKWGCEFASSYNEVENHERECPLQTQAGRDGEPDGAQKLDQRDLQMALLKAQIKAVKKWSQDREIDMKKHLSEAHDEIERLQNLLESERVQQLGVPGGFQELLQAYDEIERLAKLLESERMQCSMPDGLGRSNSHASSMNPTLSPVPLSSHANLPSRLVIQSTPPPGLELTGEPGVIEGSSAESRTFASWCLAVADAPWSLASSEELIQAMKTLEEELKHAGMLLSACVVPSSQEPISSLGAGAEKWGLPSAAGLVGTEGPAKEGVEQPHKEETGALFELTFDAELTAIEQEAFAAQVAMDLVAGLQCKAHEVQVLSLREGSVIAVVRIQPSALLRVMHHRDSTQTSSALQESLRHGVLSQSLTRVTMVENCGMTSDSGSATVLAPSSPPKMPTADVTLPPTVQEKLDRLRTVEFELALTRECSASLHDELKATAAKLEETEIALSERIVACEALESDKLLMQGAGSPSTAGVEQSVTNFRVEDLKRQLNVERQASKETRNESTQLFLAHQKLEEEVAALKSSADSHASHVQDMELALALGGSELDDARQRLAAASAKLAATMLALDECQVDLRRERESKELLSRTTAVIAESKTRPAADDHASGLINPAIITIETMEQEVGALKVQLEGSFSLRTSMMGSVMLGVQRLKERSEGARMRASEAEGARDTGHRRQRELESKILTLEAQLVHVDMQEEDTSQRNLVAAPAGAQPQPFLEGTLDFALNRKDLETRLEASRAEAGMMKSRAEDLERRLNGATKAGSAASVANAELKEELSTLKGGLTELVRELDNAIDFACVTGHRICASLRQSAADSRPAAPADKGAACEQAKIWQLQEMIDLQKLLLAHTQQELSDRNSEAARLRALLSALESVPEEEEEEDSDGTNIKGVLFSVRSSPRQGSPRTPPRQSDGSNDPELIFGERLQVLVELECTAASQLLRSALEEELQNR
jgi:hypothetical protein